METTMNHQDETLIRQLAGLSGPPRNEEEYARLREVERELTAAGRGENLIARRDDARRDDERRDGARLDDERRDDERDIWSGYSRRGTVPKRAPRIDDEAWRLPSNPYIDPLPPKRSAWWDLLKTLVAFLAFVLFVAAWIAVFIVFWPESWK